MLAFGLLILKYPDHMVDGFVYLAGFFSLAYGCISFLKFFFGEDKGRIFPDLFLGLMLCGMALLLFRGSAGAREWLLFGLSSLLLLLAVNVMITARDMRYQFRFWWLSILLVLLSVYCTYLIVTGNSSMGFSTSVFTALQLILMGVLMVWMGLLDKKTEAEYRKTLNELKADNATH